VLIETLVAFAAKAALRRQAIRGARVVFDHVSNRLEENAEEERARSAQVAELLRKIQQKEDTTQRVESSVSVWRGIYLPDSTSVVIVRSDSVSVFFRVPKGTAKPPEQLQEKLRVAGQQALPACKEVRFFFDPKPFPQAPR
jgi:hypothetical protein